MRLQFSCFLLVLVCAQLYAQSPQNFNEMLLEAELVLYTEPEQSGKIVDHVIHKSEITDEIIRAYLLQGRSYYVRGEYNHAVQAVLEGKKLAESSENLQMQLEINAFGIHFLNLLGLDLAAEKYLDFTVDIINEHGGDINNPYLRGSNSLIQANSNREQEQFRLALENLMNAKAIFQVIQNPFLVTEADISLTETYFKAQPIDSAQLVLEKLLQPLEIEHKNAFLKMIILNQLGQVYFLKKQYHRSISTYLKALDISEELTNNVYKNRIVDGLAINYLALEDADNFYAYKKIENELAKQVETDEANAVNTVFNYANANHTAKRDLVKATYERNLKILGGLLFLVLASWLVLKIRYRYRSRQFEEFIRYFENRQKAKVDTASPKKEITKSTTIPKETEQLLLQKLDQFENSIHFTKKDMSLALLASQFDTNTKYLSEVINNHKGKNFNAYINELRINYIIDKLKSNSTYSRYKISYLAEESGFVSHSSFATVFKLVTGIPPTVFIELLGSNTKSSKVSQKELEHAD